MFKENIEVTEIIIPETFTSIPEYTFTNCSALTSVTIPNNVTSIGRCAFQNCSSLTSIEIANGVTSIEFNAFNKCESLTSIVIPSNITEIQGNAFTGCSSLTSVHWNAKNCNDFNWSSPFNNVASQIISFTFGDSVQHIPARLLAGMSKLTSITIPSNIQSIGDNNNIDSLQEIRFNINTLEDFINSSINKLCWEKINGYCARKLFKENIEVTEIIIPETFTSIPEYTFTNCSALTSVTIPNNVTSIGRCAFQNCSSLTSIEIANGVTSIEFNAFNKCESLTSIVIPSNITEIQGNAFTGCSSLTSVHWNAKNCNDFNWSSPFNNVATQITSFTFGDSVQHIPAKLLAGMSKLTSITIPSNIQSIRDNNNIDSLQEIRFNINTLEDFINSGINELCHNYINGNCIRKLFKDDKELVDVIIPNDITSIPQYTFANCASITSFTFHNNVTYIGLNALMGTAWFNNQPDGCVYAGRCLYKYKGYMPYGTNIDINENCVYICDRAFADCDGLNSIVIHQNISSIGEGAFDGCFAMTSLKCYAPDNYNYPLIFQINNKPNLKELACPASWLYDFNEMEQYPQQLEKLAITEGEVTEKVYNFIKNSKKTLHTLDLTGASNYIIEDLALKGCYTLENITFPKNLGIIGYEAFSECTKIQTLEIPSSVTEIKERAFENCRSVSSITFTEGSNLRTIGSWAFYNNHSLTRIEIPEGVETIGDIAFYGCDFLEELILPSTINSIGENGFAECSNVQQMRVNAPTPPDIQSNTFDKVSRNIEFIVPKEAIEAYSQHKYWREFVPTTKLENVVKDYKIFTQNGTLHIEGAETDYQIHDISGQLVYSGNATAITLPRGIYLITINDKTKKITL